MRIVNCYDCYRACTVPDGVNYSSWIGFKVPFIVGIKLGAVYSSLKARWWNENG